MAEDCGNVKIAVGEAADQLVGDVMIKRAKTLPVEATVADVRRLFENGSVQTGLLVDDGRFRAAIEFAVTPIAKVRPTTPMSEAISLLDSAGTRRLVVVDEDGETLRGLVALNSSRSGFCGGGE